MQLSIRPVPLSSIEFATTWNLHPWDLDRRIPGLAASFSKLGVIHPPVVLRRGSSFTPLAGYRRLRFYQSTLHDKPDAAVECLTVPEDTGVEMLLDILLCDQQAASPLSLPEKARFLSIAAEHLPASDIVDRYFDTLSLKKRPSTFTLLNELLQQDELIITEAHAERLPLHMVESILQLRSKSDRVALVELFKKLNLGAGKQKKFFSLIRDISHRNEMSIGDFLASEAIVALLETEEMNIPQIINNFGKALEQELAPNSTRAEKEFGRKVHELKLPAHVQLSHSPFFEKDEVTLSITFENFEKCCVYLKNDARLRGESS